MPALGKEIERGLTPDEIALVEIQGYIDRAERQAETQQPQINKPQQVSSPSPNPQIINDSITVGTVPIKAVQRINLPINQTEVESGLKRSVVEGIRWLSEWCVMMIKKYPGRVFYLPQNTNR
jgi:hypothetical protein